jgi:predicted ATP-dependent endonuclease of OLD family
MQIIRLDIRNLRSIAALSVDFENVTALLGGNNSGKSTILRALQLFFEAAPKIEDDDYHQRKATFITVTVKFARLTEREIEELGGGLIDGELTITRVFNKTKEGEHGQYSVTAPACLDFVKVRGADGKADLLDRYRAIRDQYALPNVKSADDAESAMANWEQNNKSDLTLVPVRNFFGAPNVANGKIRKRTSVHYIPAVADAAEQTSESKKNPIITLLGEIAKQVYENKIEVRDFVDKARKDFEEIVRPENFPQLAEISDQLTASIQRYYQDSKLLANWQTNDGLTVQYPQPSIKIEESGFVTGLSMVGHGLQRVALFSVIEFLARKVNGAKADADFNEAQSDIILLVEEPEIYQHPVKQKIIHDAFHSICTGFSAETGIRFQVVFTTHSEKFVGIKRFQSARILRRINYNDAVVNSCASINIRNCSDHFARILGKEPLSIDAFEAKMHVFSRELCEGFFASKIILVEGVSDKAVLEGAYGAMGRRADAEGIAILSTDGKTKMDKPFYIFNMLGIPTYLIFDSDAKKNEKKVNSNFLLQKLAGVELPLDFPDGVFDAFCSFGQNLEGYLKAEAGVRWEEEAQVYKDEYGFVAEDICKTPAVVAEICAKLRNEGITLDRFNGIIEKVDKLMPWQLGAQ